MRLCSYIPFCDQLCNPPEEKKAPAVPDPKEDLSDSLLKSHVKGANYSARRKEMLAAERKTQGVDAAKRADQEEAAAKPRVESGKASSYPRGSVQPRASSSRSAGESTSARRGCMANGLLKFGRLRRG